MDPESTFKVTELTKNGAIEWGKLTDEDKVPFVKLADADKVRFEKELDDLEKTGSFTNADGVNSKDIKPKIKKIKVSQQSVEAPEATPVAVVHKPKKACVAFMFYVKEKSSNLMKERDDLKTAADAIKVLGKQWSEMTEEEKQPYLDLRAKDMERHDKQMKEFQETGQWTLEDGTSSKDLAPKIKKIKRGSYLQKRVVANNPDINQDEKIAPQAKVQRTQ